MSTPGKNCPILKLRIALTTGYERSVKFYSEGLGIEPAQFWDNDQGAAALEIFD